MLGNMELMDSLYNPCYAATTRNWRNRLPWHVVIEFMRSLVVVLLLLVYSVEAQTRDYPRDIFNTGEVFSGTKPFPSYDPFLLTNLYDKRHEIELQMFDAINEGALRRDKKLRYELDLFHKDLGYIPSLAAAHYKWVFGDKAQLDWLLAEDRKYGFGGDSLTMLVFAYMDEWDKTIRALKQREAYLSSGPGGATSELLYRAIEIRKRLYGSPRFERAWKAAKIK